VIELLAVSQASTPWSTFSEGVGAMVAAGIGGIGICERTLGPHDAEDLTTFRASGLRATSCVPAAGRLLTGGVARVDDLCTSVRRLAAFDPIAITAPTGPVVAMERHDARSTVLDALRAMARTAAPLHPGGVDVAIEVALGHEEELVGSVAAAVDLVDAVGEPNVRVVLDVRRYDEPPATDEVEGLVRCLDLVCLVVVGHLGPTIRSLVGDLHRLGYRGWYELRRSWAGIDDIESDLRSARDWFRTLVADPGPEWPRDTTRSPNGVTDVRA
jgi:hypothetical protein